YQVNPLAKFQQHQGNEVYIATVDKEHLYPVYKEFGDSGETLDQEDKVYEDATGVKIIRVKAKGYYFRRLVYTNEIFKVVELVKPDVLFVHCVETITAMRFMLKGLKYPMMFDSHMLSMASQNKFAKLYEKLYAAIFGRKIRDKGYIVVRTQDDKYVNGKLGIPEAQTPFISFGTDTILFSPSIEVRNSFRKEHNISEDVFVVVYTGKLTEAKGGMLLAETFKEKFSKEVILVCVGTPPNNEYGEKVRKILKESQNRVIMFPTQKYQELAKFYQMADLSVFPKQCSMSFYDAQACGLPVLSEDNNVNVDRCSYNNGFNFKAGSVEDFRTKIKEVSHMSAKE
ncbi:glycosyltransferase family 4 protein, partial [Bacteroides ovatus]